MWNYMTAGTPTACHIRLDFDEVLSGFAADAAVAGTRPWLTLGLKGAPCAVFPAKAITPAENAAAKMNDLCIGSCSFAAAHNAWRDIYCWMPEHFWIEGPAGLTLALAGRIRVNEGASSHIK
jgi:hypothetical protein